MTRIKICGLTRPEDIDAVNRFMPDYIGFVFAESRRQVDDVRAKELRLRLASGISAVGVFVNEDIGRIEKLCRAGVINLVQLHGEEDEAYVRKLKQYISKPIIRAVRIKDEEEVNRDYRGEFEYLLFDTYHKDLYGGSGKSFDWSRIGRQEKPYFLAGGLSSDNVLDAISKLDPYGVDISSGVEIDGLKDADKIGEIINKIREYKKH